MKALAFAGHWPESLPFGEDELSPACIRLKALMLDEIMKRAEAGYATFYCGAARGADLIFGRQVLLVKETSYPDIRLVCVIPHEGQANSWSEKWRERYFTLLEQADDNVLISARYTPDCYHQRNRYMVDHSDVLLAVYNGDGSGGTAYTVKYACHQNKETIVLDPVTLERRVVPPRLQAL